MLIRKLIAAIILFGVASISTTACASRDIDPDLKAADNELNRVYRHTKASLLETEKVSLVKDQRAWVKNRDSKCLLSYFPSSKDKWLESISSEPLKLKCVLKETRLRISSLKRSRATQLSSNIQTSKTTDPSNFCESILKQIKSKSIKRYYLKSTADQGKPRTLEYANVDIDMDGIADKTVISSGSGGSFLQVWLSTGDTFDLESGHMRLLKISNKFYALSTHWKRRSSGLQLLGYRLYVLEKNGAISVCDYIVNEVHQ